MILISGWSILVKWRQSLHPAGIDFRCQGCSYSWIDEDEKLTSDYDDLRCLESSCEVVSLHFADQVDPTPNVVSHSLRLFEYKDERSNL